MSFKNITFFLNMKAISVKLNSFKPLKYFFLEMFELSVKKSNNRIKNDSLI